MEVAHFKLLTAKKHLSFLAMTVFIPMEKFAHFQPMLRAQVPALFQILQKPSTAQTATDFFMNSKISI